MPSIFQKKLTSIAQQQHAKYHLMRENQEPLASQIQTYWRDLGLSFTDVGVPWSAVFVSWCVKQAGATAQQFVFSPSHSQFVYAAIANTHQGVGVFRGRAPASYAPKIGDILQNNRAGNQFDFQYAKTHKNYKSHSAIVIEVGVDNRGHYLRTIGGNEDDSVGMKEVRLDTNGKVKNTSGLYISVIETLL
jgi:hypothetical protein